jgi:alkylation response protein AidB-like acyl-CoA dehydrogenase
VDLDQTLRDAIATTPIFMDAQRRELAALARGYLARQARRHADESGVTSVESWLQLAAEQAWPGLALAPEHGGLGVEFADLAAVILECGRELAFPELVSTGVFGSAVLASADGDASVPLLRNIAEGTCRVAIANGHVPGPIPGGDVTVGGGPADEVTLTGSVGPVLDAGLATLLIVPAETPAGTALYAVDVHASGVDLRLLESLDITRAPAAHVTLAAAPAVLLHRPGDAESVWRQAQVRSTIALAAEQVGGAERALEMIVEYVSYREQFGRPIGSFQAIKHRCADLLVELQAARSAVEFAILAASDDLSCVVLAASIAKATASRAFTMIASECVHLHGGIGFTWEHSAHRYFRRARADEVILGDPAWHDAEIARAVSVCDFEASSLMSSAR